MNATELNHLVSPMVSHISRSLYSFYLRPKAEQCQNIIDLGEIAAFLTNNSKYLPTSSSLDLAVTCLKELEEQGFVVRNKHDSSWEGQKISLPFFVSESETMPKEIFAMNTSWRPGPNFSQAALIVGLEDCSFTESELKAFASYWSARPEQRNQTGWERSFAQRLLKYRSAKTARVKSDASLAIREQGAAQVSCSREEPSRSNNEGIMF